MIIKGLVSSSSWAFFLGWFEVPIKMQNDANNKMNENTVRDK